VLQGCAKKIHFQLLLADLAFQLGDPLLLVQYCARRRLARLVALGRSCRRRTPGATKVL
jgi:hypothetical protein